MAMIFSDFNLSKPLLNALHEAGFETPTPIQERSFSVIMAGKDVLGIAQTGTGKTMAYLLPVLRMWKFSKERFPQILIVVPTRELVVQVVEAVNVLTSYMNIVTVGVYGGTGMLTQMEAVEAGSDVIVATPGRLVDLVMKGSLKLKNIKKFILDEVDEMLDLGFKHQIRNLLDMLPEKRQNLFFSATMTEEVEELIEEFFDFPERIEVAPSGQPLENIEQIAYEVPNFYTKVNLLTYLIENEESLSKVLIFVSTKKMADRLFEIMNKYFPQFFAVIHSNKSQNYRFIKVNEFEKGEMPFLISTDLVARGVDIEDVTHVINFDLPGTAEGYIHRIGRTGRAEKKGTAINFISPKDLSHKKNIETLMDISIDFIGMPDAVEISEVLIEEEKPEIKMKKFLTKPFNAKGRGEVFHKKALRNTKVRLTREELKNQRAKDKASRRKKK